MAIFATRNFYHSNQNNLAIATTNSGVGTPTEEIGVSVTITGTIAVTTGNTAVTGTGTLFTTELAVGNYLFHNVTNQYIGRVASITNNASLTLETGGSYITASGINVKKAVNTQTPITGDILVRIGTVYVNPTTVLIPKISQLRNPNGPIESNYTDTTYIQLTRESDIGVPGSSVTSVNVPLSIKRLNVFTQASLPTGNYFPNPSDLPTYIWYHLNPNGTLNTLLNVFTRYNLLWSESLPDIAITTNMNYSLVNNGDY